MVFTNKGQGMKSYRQFLESSYAARDNESEIVHHVSPSQKDFSTFRPMSHFGSAAAARSIAKAVSDMLDNPRIHHYSARISLGKVHELPDDHDGYGETHSPDSIARVLHKQGIISREEASEPTHTRNHASIARLVRSKGIHTLRYRNNIEGGHSYIITHPSQVRILSKTKPGAESIVNTKRSTPADAFVVGHDPFY